MNNYVPKQIYLDFPEFDWRGKSWNKKGLTFIKVRSKMFKELSWCCIFCFEQRRAFCKETYNELIMETVTIPKEEYDSLVEDSTFLNALRAAGVDNWEGYSIAIESLEEES